MSEVNQVQSSSASCGKNKNTKSSNKQEKSQDQTSETKSSRKAKYPCLICGEDHFTKDCPRRKEVHRYFQNLPSKKQQLISRNSTPQHWGQWKWFSSCRILKFSNTYAMNVMVNMTTWTNTYDSTSNQNGSLKGKALVDIPPSTRPSNSSLLIEKNVPDSVLSPLKETIWKLIFNPNYRASQHYNIV